MTKQNLNISLQELAEITSGSWHNLKAKNADKRINWISTDSRNDCTNALFVALCGDILDGHKYVGTAIEQNAPAVCINKNKLKYIHTLCNTPFLLVDDTFTAYQKIAAYHRLQLTNLTLIGLTGSNGKTSTKDILYSILSSEFASNKVYATKENTNNHVGVPQNLLNLNKNHRFAIIEMGSNHLGEISTLVNIVKPDIALLTSIGPSHLEFFKDLRGVAIEKRTIFSSYNKNRLYNYAVIPSNCPEQKTIISGIPKDIPIRTFGYNKSPDLKVTYHSGSLNSTDFSLTWNDKDRENPELSTLNSEEKEVETQNLASKDKEYRIHSTLTGKHQTLNAAGAALVANILGIKRNNITKHLANPVITGMRMRISIHNSVTWINDAYNANPASVNAGIEYLAEITENNMGNKVYVLLGSMLELGNNSLNEHMKILKKACTLKNNAMICGVGNLILEAAEVLKNNRIQQFKNRKEVTDFLKSNLKPNDIVYLKSSNGAGLSKIESEFSK